MGLSAEELAAIREADAAATDYRKVDVQQAVDGRRALLAEVDRLEREAANASRDHIAEIQEMEREFRAAIADLHREYAQEMNEAGAELRAMERDLDRAERDAEANGGMGGGW